MAKIHGKEQRIGEVFSKLYAFSIPAYQRPYSWSSEQVTELYDDLLSAARRTTPTEGEPYFLGSIVLIKEEALPEAEVIDGQQRLTTLSLLLAVLLKTLPPDVVEGMRELLYEKGNVIMGTKDRFRVRLRDRDNAFFEKHVLKSTDFGPIRALDPAKLPDPQKRLRDNLLYFVDEVQKLSAEEQQRFATYLVQSTFLIVVWTPDLESAFRIFSVLNDRGLDLTAADILKAEIVGLIEERARDSYTQKWEDAEELLGTVAFTELFSHIRFLHARKKQRESVLKEFREFVKAKDAPRRFIDEQLVPYASALEQIKNQTYASTSDADTGNRYLRYLARLEESDWVAPAILFLARHSNDTTKVKVFFADLERLAAIMWLLSYDVNDRVERYGAVITAIADGANLSGSDSPLQLTFPECFDSKIALNGDIYNLSRKSKRTMILLRLDELLSSGEASYQFSLITIEHVLPQTPEETSQWAAWWPDVAQREKDVHRLGNLVLLNCRQNSSAKNFEFEKKKRAYFSTKNGTSPFSLTTQVLNETEWTPALFERRQQVLVGRLKAEWRL